MPRMTNIEVLKQMKQPIVFIRTKTRVEQLPVLIGQSYGKLASYLAEIGQCMTDVPFVAYHNMDMQNLDVQIGFHVSGPIPEKDDIQSGYIQERKIIFCIYRGAYSEIEPVYEEMAKWFEISGQEPAGTVYEYYYNGPEYPESELLTKIVMPIK